MWSFRDIAGTIRPSDQTTNDRSLFSLKAGPTPRSKHSSLCSISRPGTNWDIRLKGFPVFVLHEFDQLSGDLRALHLDSRNRNRKFEPSGTRATGVDVQDFVTLLDQRLVRVTTHNNPESRGMR